jgi:hypothetical protein
MNAAASFDAWVKYYRADENTPNATISYYAKGSVALALDLTLRSAGNGSLDDVRAAALAEERGRPDRRDRHRRRAGSGRRPDRSGELDGGCIGTAELPLAGLPERFRDRGRDAAGDAGAAPSACASTRARSPASR